MYRRVCVCLSQVEWRKRQAAFVTRVSIASCDSPLFSSDIVTVYRLNDNKRWQGNRIIIIREIYEYKKVEREREGRERPFGLVPIDRETRNVHFPFYYNIILNVFLGVSILVLSISPFFFCFKKEEDGDQTPRVLGRPKKIQQLFFLFFLKKKLLTE